MGLNLHHLKNHVFYPGPLPPAGPSGGRHVLSTSHPIAPHRPLRQAGQHRLRPRQGGERLQQGAAEVHHGGQGGVQGRVRALHREGLRHPEQGGLQERPLQELHRSHRDQAGQEVLRCHRAHLRPQGGGAVRHDRGGVPGAALHRHEGAPLRHQLRDRADHEGRLPGTDLETTVCQDKIVTIMDVTCKDTFDFDCQKKKAADLGMEGYGMFTSCEKIPRRRCYETPRQVRTEVCQPDHSRFCQKVTNEHPEPKKVCELQRRTRNKKAKRYSYSQDCRPVARNICETCEVKEVVPRCEQESRLTCTYVAKEKCMEKAEQYCYKQEVKTQVEVCDDKFTTYNL